MLDFFNAVLLPPSIIYSLNALLPSPHTPPPVVEDSNILEDVLLSCLAFTS